MPGVACTSASVAAELGVVVGMHELAAAALEPERERVPEDALVRGREVRELAVAPDDCEQVEAALHE